MFITSHLEFKDKMAVVKLEIILNKEIFGAMNKAVFDTTDKTLLKKLEQCLHNEIEKSHDTLKSVQTL